MSHMSLMQRPTGSSCCSSPCKLRPATPFYPCCLHVKAVPAVVASRPRRDVMCGSLGDASGTDASYAAKWTAAAEEVQLARLPRERASLQAALVKASCDLIGGSGVLLLAFGQSLCSALCGAGQLTKTPYFPTGYVALGLVIFAGCAILDSILKPLLAYWWWKDYERLCIKDWGRGVVDCILQPLAISGKNDNSMSVSMLCKGQGSPQTDPNLGHLKLHERLHDRVLPDIRHELLDGLRDKHHALVKALEWGLIKLIGAVAVYKCLVEASSPYHLAWLQVDASIPMPLYLLSMLLQCILGSAPFEAIGGVMSAYINLKLHEQECVRWCGKDSIRSRSKHLSWTALNRS